MTPGKYMVTMTYAVNGKTCSKSMPVAFVKVVAARSMASGAIFTGEKVAFAVTTEPEGNAYLKLVKWVPLKAPGTLFPPPVSTTMKEDSRGGGEIVIQFKESGKLRMLFRTGTSDTGATSGDVEVVGFNESDYF
jgi:hypothetical protein